jgi:hypothetical protein
MLCPSRRRCGFVADGRYLDAPGFGRTAGVAWGVVSRNIFEVFKNYCIAYTHNSWLTLLRQFRRSLDELLPPEHIPIGSWPCRKSVEQ